MPSRKRELHVVVDEHGEVQSAEGHSIESMTAEQTEMWAPPRVKGAQGRLTLNVGGRPVTRASLKIKGPIELPVEGQFSEGDQVAVLVTVEVGDVGFKSKHDSDGYVYDKCRVHEASMVGWAQPSDDDDGDSTT